MRPGHRLGRGGVDLRNPLQVYPVQSVIKFPWWLTSQALVTCNLQVYTTITAHLIRGLDVDIWSSSLTITCLQGSYSCVDRGVNAPPVTRPRAGSGLDQPSCYWRTSYSRLVKY
nr:uncharacterized protein LOC128693026 [Cherax quadricarinatus]